jgi:hypothetical protein
MNLESLLPKLPLMINWIDRILAAHAGEARVVGSLGFKRLPSFYSSALLSRAKVVALEHIPVPPLAEMGLAEFGDFESGNYRGITFKDTYFVQASHLDDESLHFHELVHVVQWAHLGVNKFLLTYAVGLATSGYRNSPLEAMAYEIQQYFDEGGKPGDVEAAVRSKLSELYP